MKLFSVVIMLGLTLMIQPVFAERPKIGLALAGGGAKGSAHIAVLEYLEANNIPVDFIAGTSIGAYVGALYAMGYSAVEIKQIMYGEDLNRGYSDSIPRLSQPYRTKRQNDKFNLPAEIGFRDGEVRIPSGLLYGQTVSNIYRSSVGNVTNFKSFDELAIPFRAIATDLTSGTSVVLDSGNILKAMQASATVPGALVPIEIDGRYLVDGGIADNIPIAEVKRMGADIIIAVDISSTLLDKEALDNSFAIIRQMTTFLTIKNINEQKLLLDETDIYVRPEVDELSTTEFADLPKAFDAGQIAVQKKQQQLKKLSVSEFAYEQYTKHKKIILERIRRVGSQPVVEIILLNNSNVEDAYLLEAFGLSSGVPISTQELIAGVNRVYALDRFERVDAEFEQREAGLTLIVEATEKSWGPNFFEVGIGWEDDFTLDSIITLDFAYTMGNVTNNGGEWRNEIGIGTNKSFISELYLPIDNAQRFYHSERYEFNRISQDYFINNQRSIILDQNTNRLDFTLGYKIQNNAIIEAGITFESGQIGNQRDSQRDLKYVSGGFFLRTTFDSLDRITFPTEGYFLNLSISHREEDVSGDLISGGSAIREPYFSTQYQASWKAALRNGHHGLVGKASFTYLDSESDQSIFFQQLGGFLNLSGYHKDALVGNSKAFGALSYLYDLGRSVIGLEDFPIYLGASIEAGNVWSSAQSIDVGELIAAGSLFLGTNTTLGPVALGFGFSEHSINAIYFYLGKNI